MTPPLRSSPHRTPGVVFRNPAVFLGDVTTRWSNLLQSRCQTALEGRKFLAAGQFAERKGSATLRVEGAHSVLSRTIVSLGQIPPNVSEGIFSHLKWTLCAGARLLEQPEARAPQGMAICLRLRTAWSRSRAFASSLCLVSQSPSSPQGVEVLAGAGVVDAVAAGSGKPRLRMRAAMPASRPRKFR